MKLRIAHLNVQPVLVWDDGEELSPGPELGLMSIPLSKVDEFISSLPNAVSELAAKVNTETPT